VVFEEVNVAGVVEDAGDVGGEEELAVAEAEDDGRAEARGDHLVGRMRGEDADGEGSGEALDGAADGFLERDDGVGRAALFVEDGDGLVGVGGVGCGGEGGAFFGDDGLGLAVVAGEHADFEAVVAPGLRRGGIVRSHLSRR